MAFLAPLPDEGKTALVVAHPGHELRVHALLCRLQPIVFILTDGSGRTGRSRLPASRNVIAQAGARAGDIFGEFSDRELYAALLSKDVSFFVEVAGRLARSFVRNGILRVVGDASEGYNPAHDVCRLLIDAAVARARADSKASIESWTFSLVGPPDGKSPENSCGLRLPLTPEEFGLKIEAARAYEGLDGEVESALSENGAEAFRTEWIWEAVASAEPKRHLVVTPRYERFGEARVENGFYQEVIRYDAHIRPVAEALLEMSPASP